MKATRIVILPDFQPERDLVVMVGGGFGLHAAELKQRGCKRLIALLPPGAHPMSMPVGVKCVYTMQALWRAIGQYADDPPVHTIGGIGDEVPADMAEQIHKMIEVAVQRLNTNKATHAEYEKTYQKNAACNLRRVQGLHSIAALDGKLKQPLVSVVPGPSLDRNITELRDAGGCFILAAMQAIRPLSSVGIKPHGIMVIDPSPQNVAYFLDDAPPYDLAVVAPTIAPEVMDRVNARQIFVCTTYRHPRDEMRQYFGGEAAELDSGGNVATAMFSLAVRWGADPIVLVGHDFAYEGEKTYAAGTPFGDLRYCSDDVTVPALGGGEIATSRFYAHCKWWLEQSARGVREKWPERRIWNCTEGGSLLEGIEDRSLASALASIAREQAPDPDPDPEP